MEKSEMTGFSPAVWLLFFGGGLGGFYKKKWRVAFSQNDHWLVGFNLTYLKKHSSNWIISPKQGWKISWLININPYILGDFLLSSPRKQQTQTRVSLDCHCLHTNNWRPFSPLKAAWVLGVRHLRPDWHKDCGPKIDGLWWFPVTSLRIRLYVLRKGSGFPLYTNPYSWDRIETINPRKRFWILRALRSKQMAQADYQISRWYVKGSKIKQYVGTVSHLLFKYCIHDQRISYSDWWVGNNPSEKHDSQNENRPKKARNNINAEKKNLW